MGTRFVFIAPLAANAVQRDTDGWLHEAADLVLATANAERARIAANGTVAVGSHANWRAALGAMAQSQAAAGVGQFIGIDQTGFTTYMLPAGGTWEYCMSGITGSSTVSGFGGGTAAGGMQVFSLAGVTTILDWARRIA